jgi:serine/threonine-protein kinase RsbW
MQKVADGTRTVSLTIPAEARWLALCRLVLSGLCQLGPVDDETLADLKLAVTEACSNSVRHAYEREAPGSVRIRYELGAEEVAVEIVDAGQGFDFDRPVPELGSQPDESIREDEMGLAIITALVDRLDIGGGPEGVGTSIRFSKRFASPNGSVGAASGPAAGD